MEYRQYLIGYGTTGAFGRFRPCFPARCERGDPVVVRTTDGLELGVVLCEATAGHARFLPNTTVGEFVRPATARDREVAARLALRGQELFADGRRLAVELALPLEILDAEVLLDGRVARVHYLGDSQCDPRPLLDALGERYQLLVRLHNLAEQESADAVEEPAGCGAEGCGMGNCGSGGGCSSGGCGSCSNHAPAAAPAVPERVTLL